MDPDAPQITARWWRTLLYVVLTLLSLQGFHVVYLFTLKFSETPKLGRSAQSGPNETQIQEIASLMDNIYTTLADMTYIHYSSIKRGPHNIDFSAVNNITRVIPGCRKLDTNGMRSDECILSIRRNPWMLRLLEVLPYVDPREIDDDFWLFGGRFLDYRDASVLRDENWDPLHVGGEYMSPGMIALTLWDPVGPGALLYEAENNTIRMMNNKWNVVDLDLIPVSDTKDGRRALYNHKKFAQLPSFEAPDFLREIWRRYCELEWIPWETSRSSYYYGVPPETMRDLLRKSGWPDDFDPDHFNVALIRYQYKPSDAPFLERPTLQTPSKYGYADRAFKLIEQLEGTFPAEGGQIGHIRKLLEENEKQLSSTIDEHGRWMLEWLMQKNKWYLEQFERDLEKAQEEIAALCPTGICVQEDDLILWEYRTLERQYAETQTRLREELHALTSENAPPEDLEMRTNRLEKRRREIKWIRTAASEAGYEARKHCEETGVTLLPRDTDEERARERIEEFSETIRREEKTLKMMLEWKDRLPLLAFKVKEEIERDSAKISQSIRRLEADIERDERIVANAASQDVCYE